MAADPFTALEQDHRQVERMLSQLSDSDKGPERDQLVSQLEQALTVHMQFEEQEIYPLVSAQIGSEEAEEAEIEHGLVRDGLVKVRELASAPGFGAVVEMMTAGIGHHVKEEEQEIFPELRTKVDEGTQTELSDALRAAQRSAGLPPIDLEKASKEELQQAARDAGIDVKSSMTKDELKAALASK
jgi:hemerythrin superfamily protein